MKEAYRVTWGGIWNSAREVSRGPGCHQTFCRGFTRTKQASREAKDEKIDRDDHALYRDGREELANASQYHKYPNQDVDDPKDIGEIHDRKG